MLFILPFILSIAAHCEVTPGAFLDLYYAYNFVVPGRMERSFTTQPARQNELNINLAYVDIVLDEDFWRGRLALQGGNSVEKNASHESEFARAFQEAYLGRKIAENTWIDLGIFLGNIGAESWISKDNWTYSRALNLDYVPYYSTGFRLEHAFNSYQSMQLQLINGWQNIAENNESKAIGMQYKHRMKGKSNFIYNNFFGDEEVVSTQSKFRGYHNFIFQWPADEKWQYLAALDLGHQTHIWTATSLTVRNILNETQSIASRIEYYADPHEENIVTNTPHGFQVGSVSANFDQKLGNRMLWRTEVRTFLSRDRIYPESKHSDGFLVTSISAWP